MIKLENFDFDFFFLFVLCTESFQYAKIEKLVDITIFLRVLTNDGSYCMIFFCSLLQVILHVILKFGRSQKFIILNHKIQRQNRFFKCF